jgi:hypothetical protein
MSKTVYMIRHKRLDLYKDKAGEFPDFLIEDMKQWEVISIAVTQTELHRFSIPSLYKFP